MNKRVLGVVIGLFLVLAIVGLLVYLIGFAGDQEGYRLSPPGSPSSVRGGDVQPALEPQTNSYLEDLADWFRAREKS